MDVRAQLVMVVSLDKCLGCHTCSVACKNIWTDRPGAEYMWWNNVETKPGSGYPARWEDQDRHKGGWVRSGRGVKLRAGGKVSTLLNMFFQPRLPKLEDYYEPFDFEYARLHGAPAGDDQPVAGPVSAISGKRMETISSGPNWDDDLGGAPLYAAQDAALEDKAVLDDYRRTFMLYLPRTCNHCLNPACVAACPSRALYKRGEDGVVLVDPEACRGWRFCATACPYQKVYYNWTTGEAEKCICCYPRTETAQANACAHACPGRARHAGVLLYDAARAAEALAVPDGELVGAQRSLILDPRDGSVRDAARKRGIPDAWLDAAVRSPAYALVKEHALALPLHPEFRTLPMTYYIPPLSPVLASRAAADAPEGIPPLDALRVPIGYLAKLLAAGNGEPVAGALGTLLALRAFMRRKLLGEAADRAGLRRAALDEDSAARLVRLLATAPPPERYVIPAQPREDRAPETRKGAAGTGRIRPPGRGR